MFEDRRRTSGEVAPELGEHDRTDDDGWTVRTADGALSAQFEHTVVIGAHGPEITTVVH